MAQYRARAKAGWEASASSRAEQGANKLNGNGGAGAENGEELPPEGKQVLAAKEEENQVHFRASGRGTIGDNDFSHQCRGLDYGSWVCPQAVCCFECFRYRKNTLAIVLALLRKSLSSLILSTS